MMAKEKKINKNPLNEEWIFVALAINLMNVDRNFFIPRAWFYDRGPKIARQESFVWFARKTRASRVLMFLLAAKRNIF